MCKDEFDDGRSKCCDCLQKGREVYKRDRARRVARSSSSNTGQVGVSALAMWDCSFQVGGRGDLVLLLFFVVLCLPFFRLLCPFAVFIWSSFGM